MKNSHTSTWAGVVHALICMLAFDPEVSWAREVMFTSIDRPDALNAEVYGINSAGALVGSFRDSGGSHGLICIPSAGLRCATDAATTLDLWFEGSKAVSTQIHGLTSLGYIAGGVTDSRGENHGFLCSGFPSHLRCQLIDVTFDQIRMSDTVILGIHEQALFVGSYRDSQGIIHGFISKDGHIGRIDVPGAVSTVASALTTINGIVTIVGFYVDRNFAMHGFACSPPIEARCFRTFDVVVNGIMQSMTQPMGINRDNLVGSFRDSAGTDHGFSCQLPLNNGCFMQIDALHAVGTQINGINELGELVGCYRDQSGKQRGFVTISPSLGREHATGRMHNGH